MATELAGYPLAFSTWIAQGGGLKSNRNGTMVYNSGPMRGMTRDQAAMMFQNRIWPGASDAWKNEYTRRATTGMMSPAEATQAAQPRTSVIPPRPAGTSTNAANPPANPPATTTTNRQPETVATPAPAPAASTATATTTVTPPKPKAPPQVAGPKPISSGNSSDMLTNDDMSSQGYTLIGNKGGVKKWRKNDAMDAAPAAAMTSANVANRGMIPTSVRNPVVQKPRYSKQPTNADASVNNTAPDAVPPEGNATEMPAMTVVAAPIPKGPQPFTTTYDPSKRSIVVTSGEPDEEFKNYAEAQERVNRYAGTDEEYARDKQTVDAYWQKGGALNMTDYQKEQIKQAEKLRGTGGVPWEVRDAARDAVERPQREYQQRQEAEKRAAATAKRNAEIERRMSAEFNKPKTAYGYPVKSAKELGLDDFFKKNKRVAGMAWGAGANGTDVNEPASIVHNPYNKHMSDPIKRDGLYRIEAARHSMTKSPPKKFKITPELQQWRENNFGADEPYRTNDDAFRETVVSRVIGGDVGDMPVTRRIKREADKSWKKVTKESEALNAKTSVAPPRMR
jgi:hypothetical protein